MGRQKPVFPPPREMRILSVVSIIIQHPETLSHSKLEVDLKYLNQKIQKLQKEGRKIIGIFFTDLDRQGVTVGTQLPPTTTTT